MILGGSDGGYFASSNIESVTTIGTSGIHHLGLTIPDIEKTAAFFIEQLNFKKLEVNQIILQFLSLMAL